MNHRKRPPIEPLLLDVPEAASVIGAANSTIWLMIKDGRLETVKIGRRTKVTMESVRAFIAGLPRVNLARLDILPTPPVRLRLGGGQ